MPSSTSSSRDSTVHLRGLRYLIVTLIATILTLGLATEILLRFQVQPQDQRPGHLELLARAGAVDAAFGDSHVANGFDARDGFVNLAYPSENIEDMITKVEVFYAKRAPGRVIVQADPHLFAPYRLLAVRRDLTPASPTLLLATSEHRPKLTAYWRAFLQGRGYLETTVKQTEAGALLSESDLSLVDARLQTRDARARIHWHRVAAPEQVASAKIRYSELLDMLVEKGAKICLVSYPVSPAYHAARERAGSAGQAELLVFFSREAARVGAAFWDARAHINDLALFSDVDHLNAKGAAIFANNLIDSCFDGDLS